MCETAQGAYLQLLQELVLLLRYASNDTYDAQNGAKQDGWNLGRLTVWQLHDQTAMLEAVDHIAQMILPYNLQQTSVANAMLENRLIYSGSRLLSIRLRLHCQVNNLHYR